MSSGDEEVDRERKKNEKRSFPLWGTDVITKSDESTEARRELKKKKGENP